LAGPARRQEYQPTISLAAWLRRLLQLSERATVTVFLGLLTVSCQPLAAAGIHRRAWKRSNSGADAGPLPPLSTVASDTQNDLICTAFAIRRSASTGAHIGGYLKSILEKPWWSGVFAWETCR
jgi:hypothetical protein